MAKGRNKKSRETKKPKAVKQPTQAAPTFLRPQPGNAQPATKGGAK